MLPLMKIGSAAGALGNALVPSPAPIPRPSLSQRYVEGVYAQVAAHRTREAAEASALHAEHTWRGAPAVGRVAGAALALGAGVWMTTRTRK